MSFWRRRPPSPSPEPPPVDMLVTVDVLRRSVDGVLAVREAQIRGGVVVFRGALLGEPARALDTLLARLKPIGYTPFLRAEAGETVVSAWPLADTTEPRRIGVNVLLFALTCVSTLAAGWMFSGSDTFDALRNAPGLARFLAGVPFAATLLTILGVHEFGHYFTARRYGAQVSLPYFIPAPPPLFPFGTLGALIRMRSPAKSRNALFDIAAAGPLAGLAIAVPAVLLGLAWSRIAPIPPGERYIFGDSLLTSWLTRLYFGEIPPGMMLFTHPLVDASWVGLFVTALNLIPVGQLDGGRIAYALFGARQRAVAYAAFGALLVLGVLTGAANWFVWAALLFFLVGFRHGPPLDDVTPLSPERRALGWFCMALIFVLLPPVPIEIG